MRRLLLSIVSLLVMAIAKADGVDRNTALSTAQAFMPGKQFAEGTTTAAARAKVPGKADAFYVFNAIDDDGFVIVSGDDRTTPILGYAEHGHLDVDQLPENMQWWLDSYARQIEALGTMLIPAVRQADAEQTPIAPLIQSQWNQYAPYNYMCPDGNYVDFDEPGYDAQHRCITGCVATAMAQVMYYWKWPQTCPALEAYECYEHTIKALPATTFKWDLMKDTYEWNETGAAADAVAELMRYCGQAVHMSYTTSSSGAAVSAAVMASIFQFSGNSHNLSRDGFSTNRWESIIYDEVAAGRPVLYSGHQPGSGHQFIVDGHDGNGLFHINWGWGGHRDSYFVLSLADPYDTHGEDGFRFSQTAIVGVKPAEEGELILPLMVGNLNDLATAVSYDRTSSEVDFSDVLLEGSVSVNYTLPPASTLGVEIGWALYQNDSFIQLLSNESIVVPAEQYAWYWNSATVAFGAGLAEGKYQLCEVYRFAGDSEWQPCNAYSSSRLMAEVTPTTLTVRLSDAENTSFRVNSITLPDEPEVNKMVDVTANVTNTGEGQQFKVGLWVKKQGTRQWTNAVVTYCVLDPNADGDVVLPFVPDEAGLYDLKITAGTTEEALGTATLKVAGNEKVIVDGVTYRCTPEYKRAIVVRNEDENFEPPVKVTILPVVTANGVDCKVIGVDDYACNGWYSMKTLTISEGVQSIGKGAFAYCYNLVKVVLPSTISSIGDYAFEGNQIETVNSYITDPPVINDEVFTNRIWNNEAQKYDLSPCPATLYGPVGTKAKYEAIKGWTMFAKIEEGELTETLVDKLKYSYNTIGSTATVINDDSYKELTEADIPATVAIGGKTYQVTTIGREAFFNCGQLEKVTFHEGLQHIGNSAFRYTRFSEASLPKTLKTLDEMAFYNCYNLEKVNIQEGLESIGNYAFAYSYRLTELYLPKTLKSIGECIITGCDNLSTVISRSSDPIAVIDNAFARESWNNEAQQYDLFPSPATLYIPIGTRAKYEAIKGWTMFAKIEEGDPQETMVGGLKYAYSTGGTTATVIQDESYQELTSVDIPATVALGGKTYHVTAIGSEAFAGCGQLEKVTFHEGLQHIGYSAFRYSSIHEVKLPSSVTTIDDLAFYNCYNIQAIHLTEGLENIGNYAFAYSYRLTVLELPSTLKSIGEVITEGCDWLKAVISHITEPFAINDVSFAKRSWNEETYEYDIFPSPATLYVPVGTKAKYEAIKGWTMFARIEEGELKETMVDGLRYSYSTGGSIATVIYDESYKELTAVDIPSYVVIEDKTYMVTTVGNSAFENCWNLNTVQLHEGLESIEKNAFSNTQVSDMTFPNTLRTIEENAFYNCNNIQTLTIPEGVETIGNYAFAYNYNLAKLELPNSLKRIGYGVINGNENLKTVSSHINEPFAVADETFGTQLWNWETQQYELRKSPATLYVPVGSKAKYLSVGGWTMFTKIEEDEGMGNGILMPESSATDDGSWYNLQGTKVDHPRKGVFIKNGRKVVFK